jgi:hypothetical protein
MSLREGLSHSNSTGRREYTQDKDWCRQNSFSLQSDSCRNSRWLYPTVKHHDCYSRFCSWLIDFLSPRVFSLSSPRFRRLPLGRCQILPLSFYLWRWCATPTMRNISMSIKDILDLLMCHHIIKYYLPLYKITIYIRYSL